MGLNDLIITPVILFIIYVLAFFLKPYLTDEHTKIYFIPALTVKIAGAIAIGIVYFFYYGFGDTVNYFDHGSKYIYEAFYHKPFVGLKLIFGPNEHTSDVYEYSSMIWAYRDAPSYFVVRVAGFIDLFTFHTYSATASIFAFCTFTGMWVLFKTFYRIKPKLHKSFAIVIFFIPSLFFWGSGILKDSITMGALGWLTYSAFNLFAFRRRILFSVCCFLLSFYLIYLVKIYILLCFVPVITFYVFTKGSVRYNAYPMYKLFVKPVVIFSAIFVAYFTISQVSESSQRYNIDNLTHTAQVTAEWINYVSQNESGAAYSLGDTDFSTFGILKKTPLAIWVSLFRPHLWEIRNPMMVLASLESTATLIFTVILLYQIGFLKLRRIVLSSPIIQFCLGFGILFAFAVGISTYNFGSLMRYKIPLIPFYLIGLILLRERFISKTIESHHKK